MRGPGFYGGLFVTVSFSLIHFGPRPAAPAIVGSAWVVLLAAAAFLTWRRTGLRLAATGIAVGAGAMVLYTRVLMRTDDLFAAPPGELAALLGTILLGVALPFAQARTEPARWARWREHAERCNAADMLLFRHIPDLRGEGPEARRA